MEQTFVKGRELREAATRDADVQVPETQRQKLSRTVHRVWALLKDRRNLRALAIGLGLNGYTQSVVRSGSTSNTISGGMVIIVRHSFLVVTCGQEAYIVDPFFQDQFQLGVSDYEYASFLQNEVPEVLVGSAQSTQLMVQGISDMMLEALERQQLPLPPWRRKESMISKWEPERFQDRSFTIDTEISISASLNNDTNTHHHLQVKNIVHKEKCTSGILTKAEPQTKIVGFNLHKRETSNVLQTTFIPDVFLPKSTCDDCLRSSASPSFFVRSLSENSRLASRMDSSPSKEIIIEQKMV